jgi:uracil-DNA glycosylase
MSQTVLVVDDVTTISNSLQNVSIVENKSENKFKNDVTFKDLPMAKDVTKIIQLARQYTPPAYVDLFKDADAELEQISSLIEDEGRPFTPAISDLFNAFHLTTNPRVVFIGQDPYPTYYQDGSCDAAGYSFGVRPGYKAPGSLRNIYKELKMEYPNFRIPLHGDLTYWMQQGCMFLNKCLTFPITDVDRYDQARKKHVEYKLWDPFIKKTCSHIAKKRPNCIYVMWGKKAQDVKEFIGEKSMSLEGVHPSGMSASRGFFGCGHFKAINAYLKTMKEPEIDWQLPGPYEN